MTNASDHVAARACTREDEALPAGCHDDRRHVREPDIGDRPQVYDLGISAMADPSVHHPPAIVDGEVVGQYLRERIPVAGCEVRQEALDHLACRVFQPRRRLVQLFESATAASTDASSKSSQRLIKSPSNVSRLIPRHSASKPSCEVPRTTCVTTAPTLLSRCTAST